ncbi:hypothetical protein ACFV3N_16925 [Streptomyces bauhiniae]|uniref:hypothetical protein n=1 Tax=Streptomyces bauhiniae TaxID=2340725 RepID=UPI003655C82C
MTPATAARPLPTTHEMTGAQYAGRACVWCEAPLTQGRVLAGQASGQIGAHVVGTPAYQCLPDSGCQFLIEGDR